MWAIVLGLQSLNSSDWQCTVHDIVHNDQCWFLTKQTLHCLCNQPKTRRPLLTFVFFKGKEIRDPRTVTVVCSLTVCFSFVCLLTICRAATIAENQSDSNYHRISFRGCFKIIIFQIKFQFKRSPFVLSPNGCREQFRSDSPKRISILSFNSKLSKRNFQS